MVSMSVVSTEWVSKHLADPSVTIVEVNTDSDKGYNTGHIQGLYFGIFMWILKMKLDVIFLGFQKWRNFLVVLGLLITLQLCCMVMGIIGLRHGLFGY